MGEYAWGGGNGKRLSVFMSDWVGGQTIIVGVKVVYGRGRMKGGRGGRGRALVIYVGGEGCGRGVITFISVAVDGLNVTYISANVVVLETR